VDGIGGDEILVGLIQLHMLKTAFGTAIDSELQLTVICDLQKRLTKGCGWTPGIHIPHTTTAFRRTDRHTTKMINDTAQ